MCARLAPSHGDDPRVRGENIGFVRRNATAMGRSPRARGKLRLSLAHCWRWGTFPACAGKTIALFSGAWNQRDDPRVRGENDESESFSNTTAGRSPRARGKLATRHPRPPASGTIPACAGKTCWVFPLAMRSTGRSPRARGKLTIERLARASRGTIPACAGKTHAHEPDFRELGDDPRVCGEDASARHPKHSPWGRSPRVRGRRGTARRAHL